MLGDLGEHASGGSHLGQPCGLLGQGRPIDGHTWRGRFQRMAVAFRFAQVFADVVGRRTQIDLLLAKVVGLVADLDAQEIGTEDLLRNASLIGRAGRFEVTEIDPKQHSPPGGSQQPAQSGKIGRRDGVGRPRGRRFAAARPPGEIHAVAADA
jgi:hypothetical protein